MKKRTLVYRAGGRYCVELPTFVPRRCYSIPKEVAERWERVQAEHDKMQFEIERFLWCGKLPSGEQHGSTIRTEEDPSANGLEEEPRQSSH